MTYDGGVPGTYNCLFDGGNSLDSFRNVTPDFIERIKLNTEMIVDSVKAHLNDPGSSGKKVVLALGELHERGAHITLETNVLDALEKQGIKCGFLYEWPPNNVDMQVFYGMSDQDTDKKAFLDYLHQPEQAKLMAYLSEETQPVRSDNARVSRAVLHAYIRQNYIPLKCSDSPRDWRFYDQNKRNRQELLTTDQGNIDAIAEAFRILNIQGPISAHEPIDSLGHLGMLARNIYMANQVEAMARDYPDLDVIFMQVGRAHVTGCDALDDPSPYEHSLANIFAHRAGFNFVGAPFYISHADRLENMPVPAKQDEHILRHLRFDPDAEVHNVVGSGTADKREAEHIMSAARYLPWVSEVLGHKNPRVLHREQCEHLNSELERIRDEHGFTPA